LEQGELAAVREPIRVVGDVRDIACNDGS